MKTRSGGNPDISLARLIKLLASPMGIFTLWASIAIAIAFMLKAQSVR
ncbi:hypothetical protein ACWATR_07595 [Nostoc sp. UIC 10890]